jgi:hypothetical protein
MSRCNTPSPAWALLTPTWAVGIIRDMTSKCSVEPIYQLPISVSNAYLQKVTRVLAVCSTSTTPYHNRAFTIKQTGYICQCFYIQLWGENITDYLVLSSNECGEKCAPGCICYRCVQPGFAACLVGHIQSRRFIQFGLWPFEHVAHGQRLNGDQPEALDQLTGHLLDEVLAPFALLGGTLLRFGETTLRFGQLFFCFSEKAGVGNLFSRGEEGKGLESYIDARTLIRRGQYLRLDLITREAHKPLSRRVSHDAARFDNAFERPVLNHLEMPDLGKGELALCIDAKARLRVGEGSVAVLGFITRIAGRHASFHALEEGFEGEVSAMQHILQDLRVDGPIFGSELFGGRKLCTLLRKGDAPAAQPISFFPLLQSGVVQLGAQGELLVQNAFLLLGRVETVLLGSPHTGVFFSSRKKRKFPHDHHLREERGFLPDMGKQGFRQRR